MNHHRLERFLRLPGAKSDAKATYSDVREGCKIRSTFIHDGPLKIRDQPQAIALAPAILEYAWRCVPARLQQHSSIPKEGPLAKLDESMIASATARDLKNALLKTIWRGETTLHD